MLAGLLTGLLIVFTVVLTAVVIILPPHTTPFCQDELALHAQSSIISRGLSGGHRPTQAQFTNFVFTTDKIEKRLAYTEKGAARTAQLAKAKAYLALAKDPLYYRDIVWNSPPTATTMLTDQRFKRFLDASLAANAYASSRIPSCHFSN
jgi:hypothetical protein